MRCNTQHLSDQKLDGYRNFLSIRTAYLMRIWYGTSLDDVDLVWILCYEDEGSRDLRKLTSTEIHHPT
jgi:hypothetical protein